MPPLAMLTVYSWKERKNSKLSNLTSLNFSYTNAMMIIVIINIKFHTLLENLPEQNFNAQFRIYSQELLKNLKFRKLTSSN